MSFKPTLALCIPAYNAAKYLPQLLQSARNQAIPFTEILVYDDCSTDNTKNIAKALGATVIDGNINRGCSFGKNRLAEITDCKWIHFHDADDLLLPNFSQVAEKWMKLPTSPDTILLNYEYKDAETDILLGSPSYDLQMMVDDPIKFSITHKIVNFGLYKKESFIKAGGFNLDPNVLYNEDAAFHQRLAIAGLKFGYEKEVTCINYRYNRSMSVSNAGNCHLAKYFVTENLLMHGLQNKYGQEIGNIYWELATLFASVRNWNYAKKSIEKAIAITNSRIPTVEKSQIFKNLCALHPFLGYYTREYFIRLFKPNLR